jgi:hypothetical protein
MEPTPKLKYNKRNFTGFFFGEGKKDKVFLFHLTEINKFKYYYASSWEFFTDHASGGSPQTVLEKCSNALVGKNYDIVICFIDIDKLKDDFPKNWEEKKIELEEKYSQFIIFWHEDKLEDEIIKVLGPVSKSKKRINKIANKEIDKFVGSDYLKKIVNLINAREKKIREKEKDV